MSYQEVLVVVSVEADIDHAEARQYYFNDIPYVLDVEQCFLRVKK